MASLLRVIAVRDQGVPGVGNCPFLRARGWGIDRQETKKRKIPGVMPGGGMVTGGIEPCISRPSRSICVYVVYSFMWRKFSRLYKHINIDKRAFLSFYFFIFWGVLVFVISKTKTWGGLSFRNYEN